MKTFKINNSLTVECTTVKTRTGHSDIAQAYIDGEPVEKSRLAYEGKKTEQWEYKTVLHKLADNTDMTVAERRAIVEYIVRESK